jgi:hypothetical protein
VSQPRLLLVAALSVAVAFAASPSIGLAVANGTFQIDKSNVYGNTNLFDGSLIETAAVSSDLVLHNGARLRLGSESQARVLPDRLMLEKGQTEISASSGYSVEALGLRVAPESPQSRLAVAYSGPSRIQVAALLGSARISGLNGVLIANVPTGTALDLEPQAAGAAAASTLSGVLESKKGAFLLPDDASHVTYTLLGAGLDQFVGKCVEVTGPIDTAVQAAVGSSQVLRVFTIKEAKGCRRAGGFFHSPKAIVAGVAVAAAGVTAGVLATQGGGKSTLSR